MRAQKSNRVKEVDHDERYRQRLGPTVVTERPTGRAVTDAQHHAIEWLPGWEYKRTWLPVESVEEIPEPEGEGWVRNVEAGDCGREALTRIRVAYWRRPKP